MKKNLIIRIMLLLSVIGFVDTVYLTMKRLVGGPITCYVFGGCEAVAQSTYGLLFGIPLSLLGALFYATTIVLFVHYLQRRASRALRWIAYVAIFGGLFSLYSFALQAFVIKAWCLYCVVSGTIGIVNALLAVYLLRKKSA